MWWWSETSEKVSKVWKGKKEKLLDFFFVSRFPLATRIWPVDTLFSTYVQPISSPVTCVWSADGICKQRERTGVLGRRLSNHITFGKQKVLKLFCKWTNKIQDSTMQPLKTLKPFKHTWPLRKQPLNSWSHVIGLFAKITWECFGFKNRCDWIIFF